jgi:hypothetical protein
MADLAHIEQRLNSDPQFREAFLEDPVTTLFAAGLILSPANAHLLRERVAGIRNMSPATPGASVRSAANRVMTTITDQFVGSSSGPAQSRPIRLIILDEL